MGYRLLAHEGERDNCFSKIILVGQKSEEKIFFLKLLNQFFNVYDKYDHAKSLLVGYH